MVKRGPGVRVGRIGMDADDCLSPPQALSAIDVFRGNGTIVGNALSALGQVLGTAQISPERCNVMSRPRAMIVAYGRTIRKSGIQAASSPTQSPYSRPPPPAGV